MGMATIKISIPEHCARLEAHIVFRDSEGEAFGSERDPSSDELERIEAVLIGQDRIERFAVELLAAVDKHVSGLTPATRDELIRMSQRWCNHRRANAGEPRHGLIG